MLLGGLTSLASLAIPPGEPDLSVGKPVEEKEVEWPGLIDSVKQLDPNNPLHPFSDDFIRGMGFEYLTPVFASADKPGLREFFHLDDEAYDGRFDQQFVSDLLNTPFFDRLLQQVEDADLTGVEAVFDFGLIDGWKIPVKQTPGGNIYRELVMRVYLGVNTIPQTYVIRSKSVSLTPVQP